MGFLPSDFIFVVRHGESEANAKGVEAGPLDYPLTKNGVKDVEFIAKALSNAKVKNVYSSPVRRAVQTARILARPHKLRVKILEELTETKIKPEFAGKKGSHHILVNPEAFDETNSDLLKRAHSAMETIRNNSGGNAILVSHGDLITGLLEDIVERKLSTGKYYVLQPARASLSIVKLTGTPSLVLYNYHRNMFAGY